jgi:dolichol kinase
LLFPTLSLLTSQAVTAVAAGVILVILLGLEVGRLSYHEFNEFLLRAGILRPRERGRVTAVTWFVLAALLLALFTPQAVAVTAWLYAIFGDWAAGAVGGRWGRHRRGEKSAEGSAASLLTCLLLAFLTAPLVELPLPVAVAGAVVATVVELAPLPPDDNLTVPLLAGMAMHLLQGIS